MFIKILIHAFKRPLSLILACMGFSGFLFFVFIIASTGSIYINALDRLDGTTLLMISVLLIKSVWVYRNLADPISFGNSVVIVLAFIYIFESIYKFLFFDWLTNPADLRVLLLQIGTVSVIMLPIGYKSIQLTKPVIGFLTLYSAFMFIWWIFGYPQIFEDVENRVIFFGADRINVTLNQVFIWNRVAKLWLFLAFVFAIKINTRK